MDFSMKAREAVVTASRSLLAAAILLAPAAAIAQDTNVAVQGPAESPLTGTVVSASRNTMVVRNENGLYQLFVFDTDTVKPRLIPVGSRVRVVSTAGDESSFRAATSVAITDAAPKPQAAGTSTADSPVVPPEVRRVERDIERQVRRYRVGVRTGVALGPELIMIGVHAQVGPFFHRDLSLRPSVEFAYGEVTSLFALNLEGVYRLPISSRQGRWSAYAGLGPGFNFLHQNFNRQNGEGSRIDFGEFHGNVGLNILGGIQYRSGMFVELKTSVYAAPAPTLRLIFGYNF